MEAMEYERLGSPDRHLAFDPVKTMAGLRYASGHAVHVGDEVTVPAHPEWGVLKVRALCPAAGRVVASNLEAGAQRLEPSELAFKGGAR